MAPVSSNKSTNVRFSVPWVRLAERLAPRWLEARAFALWCRPHKQAGRWGPLLSTARAFRPEVGDAHVAAWEWNLDGPEGTALLVHGWSGNGAQLSSFVGPLVKRGFHVVAVDLPAHGESPGHFATLVLMADALVELSRRLRPRVVIAHSLGGTALTYGLSQGPRPERLALLAPPTQLPPYLAHFSAQVGLSAAMQERLLARVESVIRRPVSELDLLRHAPGLGGVKTLVVHDRADRVAPLASSQALAAAWPGARLVVTEGLSHDRIRRDAAAVAQVVDFVTAEAAPKVKSLAPAALAEAAL